MHEWLVGPRYSLVWRQISLKSSIWSILSFMFKNLMEMRITTSINIHNTSMNFPVVTFCKLGSILNFEIYIYYIHLLTFSKTGTTKQNHFFIRKCKQSWTLLLQYSSILKRGSFHSLFDHVRAICNHSKKCIAMEIVRRNVPWQAV